MNSLSIPVKFNVIPWNFSLFCINSPGDPCSFFNFGVPLWISNEFYSTPVEDIDCWPPGYPVQFTGFPTNFTLPPGIFHWYPQQGGMQFFFWKSPFYSKWHYFWIFFIPSDTQLPGMEPVAIGSTGEPFSDEWRHNAQQVMLWNSK